MLDKQQNKDQRIIDKLVYDKLVYDKSEDEGKQQNKISSWFM